MTHWLVEQRPNRRPRNHGVGGRLTVFKSRDGWEVCYVSRVDHNRLVWCTTVPRVTTDSIDGPSPFADWRDAMAYAATLRTYYGDQCRGDNLLFDRRHR